jgi:hypothetical protein
LPPWSAIRSGEFSVQVAWPRGHQPGGSFQVESDEWSAGPEAAALRLVRVLCLDSVPSGGWRHLCFCFAWDPTNFTAAPAARPLAPLNIQCPWNRFSDHSPPPQELCCPTGGLGPALGVRRTEVTWSHDGGLTSISQCPQMPIAWSREYGPDGCQYLDPSWVPGQEDAGPVLGRVPEYPLQSWSKGRKKLPMATWKKNIYF